MPLSAGTILDHFQIISLLGVGGMGEVYLALDTKLDRKVALKILPADVASRRDRMDRFTREAKAAAALNHPNIAHVYQIGETSDVHFIAMEFIDGETLRTCIVEAPLQLQDAITTNHHVLWFDVAMNDAGLVSHDESGSTLNRNFDRAVNEQKP